MHMIGPGHVQVLHTLWALLADTFLLWGGRGTGLTQHLDAAEVPFVPRKLDSFSTDMTGVLSIISIHRISGICRNGRLCPEVCVPMLYGQLRSSRSAC
jgi:hypothetical protein